MVEIIDMAKVGRPKKAEDEKDYAVPLQDAKPGDRVIVQMRLPYDMLMALRKEHGRRVAAEPEKRIMMSDVIAEILEAGLKKTGKR
jgi:hypothetical protein